MFTFFTIPKAFDKKFNIIQLNALLSWLNLKPQPKIMLFGNELGLKQLAKRYGLQAITVIERNRFGTPLVRSIFRKASKNCQGEFLCFANADIIVDPKIIQVFNLISKRYKKFMLISRRWNLKINNRINFKDKNWFKKVKEKVLKKGQLYSSLGVDLFIFPKELFNAIPNFAIGRAVMDNWMIYQAKSKRIPIIDVTNAIILVHQNHPLKINHFEGTTSHTGQEFKRNLKLASGYGYCYEVEDADFWLDLDLNIRKKGISLKLIISKIKRALHRKIDKYIYF